MDSSASCPTLANLYQCVLRRTSWRVRDLLIEIHAGRAVLRGRATTAYARRLAEQAAQELLPHLQLDNVIVVDHDSEVLTGMPLH